MRGFKAQAWRPVALIAALAASSASAFMLPSAISIAGLSRATVTKVFFITSRSAFSPSYHSPRTCCHQQRKKTFSHIHICTQRMYAKNMHTHIHKCIMHTNFCEMKLCCSLAACLVRSLSLHALIWLIVRLPLVYLMCVVEIVLV